MRGSASVGKPGRPPLEPRIAELERQVANLTETVSKLKRMDKTTDDYLLSEKSPYTPQFDRWPGNGSAK